MTTRATYIFKDQSSRHFVFGHYDGYPTGAQQYFKRAVASGLAWPDGRFEANDFAAAFVAANKTTGGGGFRLANSIAPDVDFVYELVQPEEGPPQLSIYEPSVRDWSIRKGKRLSVMTLETFLNIHPDNLDNAVFPYSL